MTHYGLLGKITNKVDREYGGNGIMPEKIEQLLKKIHILFAKSDRYMNSEDEIIISKKEMFRILEELNYAIYEMLDQYEMTQVSKEKAKAHIEKQTENIIDSANKSAEDIYAASIMYSDHMLSEVKKVVQGQINRIQEEYHVMEHFLDGRVSAIMRNRDELHEQLQDMADDKMYLKIVEEQRKREKTQNRTTSSEGGKNHIAAIPGPGRVVEAGYHDVHDLAEESGSGFVESGTATPAIKVNVDHVAKVRKAALEERSSLKDQEVAPPAGQIYTADDFDLDAEYYKWKTGDEEEGQDSAQDNGDSLKQKIQTIFGKTK